MSQFELRLDRLAIVSLSKYLWQHDQTQAEILEIFTSTTAESNISLDNQDDLMEKVTEWAKKILPSNLNKAMLEQLQNKLLLVVKTMGKAIFSWLSESQLKVKVFDFDNRKEAVELYLKNIIWNDVGMIDWSKTIRTMIDQKKFPNSYMEYVELCFNCLEDDIINWFKKTPIDEIENINNLIRQHYNQRLCQGLASWDHHIFFIFAYWHLHYVKGSANFTSEELVNYLDTYLENDSDSTNFPIGLCQYDLTVDTNMFILCTLGCKHLGLLYFWGRMNEEARYDTFQYGFDNRYWSKCLMESSLFILKNVPKENLDWFVNDIHKRCIPYGLSDSPWFDAEPEIYNILKAFRIREKYKTYKMLLECGILKNLFADSENNFTKIFNATLQDSPHIFAEVFNYSIAKQILDNRSFSLYKDIIQHEVFENMRFEVAVEFPIRYFGEIQKDDDDDDDGDDDFMELFKTHVQEILTENEKSKFVSIWSTITRDEENKEMDIDEY